MENSAPARRGRPPGPRTAEGELTSRQAAIVRYIRESVARQGYPPSMREIGKAVELASTSSVAHQLMALERKGVLCRDPHRPRAYRVRPSWAPDLGSRSEAPVDVPLVGRIAAGAPLLAEEMVEDVYAMPRQIVGDGDLFALTVVGDSMIDAAICDGDIVTVRKMDSADHGDIVACRCRVRRSSPAPEAGSSGRVPVRLPAPEGRRSWCRCAAATWRAHPHSEESGSSSVAAASVEICRMSL
ncbi:transcriptional repressor LexA [Streptomyces mirabilis]